MGTIHGCEIGRNPNDWKRIQLLINMKHVYIFRKAFKSNTAWPKIEYPVDLGERLWHKIQSSVSRSQSNPGSVLSKAINTFVTDAGHLLLTTLETEARLIQKKAPCNLFPQYIRSMSSMSVKSLPTLREIMTSFTGWAAYNHQALKPPAGWTTS